jgi:hypothetical protein
MSDMGPAPLPAYRVQRTGEEKKARKLQQISESKAQYRALGLSRQQAYEQGLAGPPRGSKGKGIQPSRLKRKPAGGKLTYVEQAIKEEEAARVLVRARKMQGKLAERESRAASAMATASDLRNELHTKSMQLLQQQVSRAFIACTCACASTSPLPLPFLTARFRVSLEQHELKRMNAQLVFSTAARFIAESEPPLATARVRSAPVYAHARTHGLASWATPLEASDDEDDVPLAQKARQQWPEQWAAVGEAHAAEELDRIFSLPQEAGELP